MTDILGRGECGSHVTLLFSIADSSEDIVQQGSLGSGLCLEAGSEVVARGWEGDGSLSIRFLGRGGEAGLYEEVVSTLSEFIPEVNEFDWEITVKLKVPVGQGFGMSASGAISATMAMQRAMGMPYEESLRRSHLVAHIVDRKQSSGLGDVSALSAGGVELRLSPGSPYNGHLLESGPGEAVGWSNGMEVVLAWGEGPGSHTSTYIDDPDWKVSISHAGNEQLAVLSEGDWNNGKWPELIEAAIRFSQRSGLSDEPGRSSVLDSARSAISRCGMDDLVVPLLCMLGESVVIVPCRLEDIDFELSDLLSSLEEEGLSGCITKVNESS
ncbi:MAG: hypothetical protein QGI73_02080 [Candidatus Thalassarchaeaceae archaeon]|jgi:pantoate kinase|nr:hypothetical protein [Euryarchaeota archaeon]MDP6871006.1 hypothetical protein [Candidatus Thalassarchaeaceae archaeon]|tara:strand:+ start:19 stop:996 length:978 start_codon:yes stop_codon:yes gene_type:complete